MTKHPKFDNHHGYCLTHGIVHFIVRTDAWRGKFAECAECAAYDRQERQRRSIENYKKRIDRTCAGCGKSYTYTGGGATGESLYCMECQEIRLRNARTEDRARVRGELFEKYRDASLKCESGGTCDVLQRHHDLLADDDQRLSTEFILQMVSPELAMRYKIKREAEANGEA